MCSNNMCTTNLFTFKLLVEIYQIHLDFINWIFFTSLNHLSRLLFGKFDEHVSEANLHFLCKRQPCLVSFQCVHDVTVWMFVPGCAVTTKWNRTHVAKPPLSSDDILSRRVTHLHLTFHFSVRSMPLCSCFSLSPGPLSGTPTENISSQHYTVGENATSMWKNKLISMFNCLDWWVKCYHRVIDNSHV